MLKSLVSRPLRDQSWGSPFHGLPFLQPSAPGSCESCGCVPSGFMPTYKAGDLVWVHIGGASLSPFTVHATKISIAQQHQQALYDLGLFDQSTRLPWRYPKPFSGDVAYDISRLRVQAVTGGGHVRSWNPTTLQSRNVLKSCESNDLDACWCTALVRDGSNTTYCLLSFMCDVAVPSSAAVTLTCRTAAVSKY